MKKKKFNLYYIFVVLLLVGFFSLFTNINNADAQAQAQAQAQAGTGLFEGIGNCQEKGDCTLCNFITLFTNIARFILSITGGLAMIYFIWAGIGFIMSFGNPEKVEASKKTIIGATLGIVIIVGAWTLVNILFFHFIGPGTNSSKPINIWNNAPWSSIEGC